MFDLWVTTTNFNATRIEVIEMLQKDDIGECTVAEKYIKALKIIRGNIFIRLTR